MAQFKVGGKVVCLITGKITNSYQETFQFKTGQTFTVRAIKECECGCIMLDIGLSRKREDGVIKNSLCAVCHRKTETLTLWIQSKHFVPIEETEFRQVTFEKIINEIPVSAQ